MKDEIEFDKTFDEKNLCVLLFNLRHIMHTSSFRIVNMLCCGGQFSNITFINAKTKYRCPYLMDIFLALLIEPYKDVFRTSEKDILRTPLRNVLMMSVGHVPWSYILDHLGMSS